MLVRLLSEPYVKALMQMVIDDACSLELDSTKSTNQKGLWWIVKLTETKYFQQYFNYNMEIGFIGV
jgi:hypothetical protein